LDTGLRGGFAKCIRVKSLITTAPAAAKAPSPACTPRTGKITINGRDIDDYFGLETLKLITRQPVVLTETVGKVDIVATVAGGGVTGQAGALRHGISRALLLLNPEYRPALKAAGFLTRDPRMKERKKYGLKAARRAPQFSKR